MAVLIDSSVWIAASRPKTSEGASLRKLIERNELIHVAHPIQTEVCQGAASEEEFHRLWDAFLGFDFLEITARHWGMSGWNYFRCRKKGVTLSTLDCLIGTLSVEYGVPLWTLDKTLLKASPLLGFDVFD